MNYVEWALQKGLELWRERDKALRKRLILVPERKDRKENQNAQSAGDALAVQDAERSKAVDDAPAEIDLEETAAVRLGRKLGIAEERESGRTETKDAASMNQMDALPRSAALLPVGETENANEAAAWMQKLLRADGRDGASAAEAKERSGFSLAQEQEVRETESFSLSLERDARRYDGGFLFY